MDYFCGGPAAHSWGVLGGLIWGTGTICSFVAAYTPMVGPATSFSLSEGNTMISAVWGVFVWNEFRGASSEVRHLLALMFALFVLGLVSISLAPVFA
jgi:glucose uptake protein